MQWVIAENNRFPSASMRAPVSVIFIGSDWGWWGTLKLAALLFSMGLSDWWLLLWREGVFLTACTLGLISGTSARSNGVCVGTSGMACSFLHLLICVHVCNVKGAELSRFRHAVGCQCVCVFEGYGWMHSEVCPCRQGFPQGWAGLCQGQTGWYPWVHGRDIIPHRTWPWAAFRSVCVCNAFRLQ